jgi:hypothetical protein
MYEVYWGAHQSHLLTDHPSVLLLPHKLTGPGITNAVVHGVMGAHTTSSQTWHSQTNLQPHGGDYQMYVPCVVLEESPAELHGGKIGVQTKNANRSIGSA